MENEFRQVSAPCTNEYDLGLTIAQVVYKFLNNQICVSFDGKGCVAEDIIATPLNCNQCHDSAETPPPLEIAREAVRDAMTYAMNTINPSEATVGIFLKTMYMYIETHYWNVILAPEDRQRVQLAFIQHGVDI